METFPPDYLEVGRGSQLVVVSIAMGFLEILVVLARFLAQRQRKAPLGAEDYAIFPALVC